MKRHWFGRQQRLSNQGERYLFLLPFPEPELPSGLGQLTRVGGDMVDAHRAGNGFLGDPEGTLSTSSLPFLSSYLHLA